MSKDTFMTKKVEEAYIRYMQSTCIPKEHLVGYLNDHPDGCYFVARKQIGGWNFYRFEGVRITGDLVSFKQAYDNLRKRIHLDGYGTYWWIVPCASAHP